MDIVLRAAIVFVMLGLIVRITGKRQIAQLSAFDLVMVVTMGDLIGQTVVQEDYSMTAGMLALCTFAVLSIVVGVATYLLPWARPALEGEATIVVRDGEMDHQTMRFEMIHTQDLMEACRAAGVRDISEVELAIFENDGTFSFFKRDDGPDEDKMERPDDDSEESEGADHTAGKSGSGD